MKWAIVELRIYQNKKKTHTKKKEFYNVLKLKKKIYFSLLHLSDSDNQIFKYSTFKKCLFVLWCFFSARKSHSCRFFVDLFSVFAWVLLWLWNIISVTEERHTKKIIGSYFFHPSLQLGQIFMYYTPKKELPFAFFFAFKRNNISDKSCWVI